MDPSECTWKVGDVPSQNIPFLSLTENKTIMLQRSPVSSGAVEASSDQAQAPVPALPETSSAPISPMAASFTQSPYSMTASPLIPIPPLDSQIHHFTVSSALGLPEWNDRSEVVESPPETGVEKSSYGGVITK